jgi:hypothetical protein
MVYQCRAQYEKMLMCSWWVQKAVDEFTLNLIPVE